MLGFSWGVPKPVVLVEVSPDSRPSNQGQVVLMAPTDGGGWENQSETIQHLGSIYNKKTVRPI